MEKLDFTEVSLFIVRVIMAIMHAPVEELLCQVAMGRIPVLKYTCCQARGGTCGHVLSCQALNVAAFQGPGSSGAYPVLNGPGRVPSRGSQGDETDWADRR
jgi:hypothetical protein